MPFLLSQGAHNSGQFYSFLPHNFQDIEKPPVVVFLHGSGERGSDPALPVQGLHFVMEELQLPAVTVFPQCHEEYRAYYGAMEDRVLLAIEHSIEEFQADSSRIYLVGYSMGGSSIFWLLARYPGKFAGTVCIAPGITWLGAELPPHLPPSSKALFDEMFVAPDRPEKIARQINGVPTWFLQGTLDEPCPIDETRAVVEEMRKIGRPPKVSEYEGWGHDTLVRALREDGLFPWLFSHSTENRAL